MADKSKIELVIEVDPAKANAGIKSVNNGLSGMEQAAVRAARVTSSGMDGFTASMVKGAAAGNLIAESVKTALGWLKQMTVEVAKYAARTEVLGVVTQQLAKVNDISASKVDLLVNRIKALGITTQEAHGVVQRMIFAELDLGKAVDLARVAQNAAVIAGVDSSEALENIILGITTGQTRLLHNMGIQVSLLNVEAQAAKEVGHALSEHEKRSAMLNAVLKEGTKINGTYEAAMQKVGKQMTSLKRYFDEAKNAVGEQFLPIMQRVVDGAKEMAVWVKDNASSIADFAKTVGVLVAAGTLGMLVQNVWGLVGALQAASVAAAANPIGLIATGVAAAGGILYSEWRKMKQPFEDMDAAYGKWLTSQITGAKTGADLAAATDKVEKAFAGGTIQAKQYAQALDMIEAAKARVYGWGDLSDFSKNLGLKIKIPNPKEEAAAAAAMAEEVRKQQLANEKAFRDRALEAGKAGLTGFAKDLADINAEIGKRTMGTNEAGVSFFVPLTKKAWASIIEEARLKLDAFKKHFADENRKALSDYLKGEEEAGQKRMEWDARAFQKRLDFDTQWHAQAMDHLREVMAFEEQRAGFTRDARLRELDAVDAQTLQQKLAVEQRKADIEVEYLEKVHEVKLRLFDADTSMKMMEYELEMKRLNIDAGVIEKRLAEYSQVREQIRQQQYEATDAAIDAARQSAANRQAQLVRDQNRQIFESLKQQAGGVFDALLQKSQSVWSAIGNAFKTAMLTAIKEVVTSRVAAMLMQMFTGTKVGFQQGGIGGGALARLGGFLGIGAVPVFASGGMGPGGTPPFLPAGTVVPAIQSSTGQVLFPGGTVGATPPFVPQGSQAGGMFGNLAGMFKNGNWMKTAGGMAEMMGGLMMLNGVSKKSAFQTIGGGAMLGAGIGLSGGPVGAIFGAGLGLALNGLQRGGFSGLAQTTAGGAMMGWNVGGPLGAAIGAGIGAIAGVVRLFVKGAQEKAREKIKATYGVDISDNGVLRQIVETAKQAFGGNIDMAIRSQQIRDLIQLYAMSTGQKPTGMPGNVTPLSFMETGGSLYQGTSYSNGTPLPGLSGLPSFDNIGAGVGSTTIVVNNQLPADQVGAYLEGKVVSTVVNVPRASQQAVLAASKSNAGRRELTALQLSPGTLTS